MTMNEVENPATKMTMQQQTTDTNLHFITTKEELDLIFKPSFTLVDEIGIQAKSDGLKARFMDQTHVALIELNFDHLTDYGLLKNNEFNFSIKAEAINPILKTLDKNREYEFILEDLAGDKMSLYLNELSDYRSSPKRTIERVYQITIDKSTESFNTPIPKIEYPIVANLELKEFTDILTSFKSFDYLEIIYIKDHDSELILKSVNDQGKMQRTLKNAKLQLDKIDDSYYKLSDGSQINRTVSVIVTLEYLTPFVKSLKNTGIEEIAIHMAQAKSEENKMYAKPLKITYSQGQQNQEFWLAPRIEN